jgi:actin
LLFKPFLNGFEWDSIHEALLNSIMKCDTDIRKEASANIVLPARTTMFEGLLERLEKEIIDLVPARTRVKVSAPPERKHGVRIGGSIVGSLAIFPKMAITCKESDETGAHILHQKCS